MASKINYFTRNNRPVTVPYPYRGEMENEYEKVCEHGRIFIKHTGKFNLQEFINAPKEDCLIYNAIERFVNGDADALNRVKTFYADVSAMPKDLLEAHYMMERAKYKFDTLPLEVREQFNNSATKFVHDLNTSDKVHTVMSDYIRSKENPVLEVKTNDK